MGRRKKKLFDTTAEEEFDDRPSRTKLRAERKDLQSRLESLAVKLAKVVPERREVFAFDEVTERELGVLAKMRPGSAMARQRKRVAGLLRHLDLDVVERHLAQMKSFR